MNSSIYECQCPCPCQRIVVGPDSICKDCRSHEVEIGSPDAGIAFDHTGRILILSSQSLHKQALEQLENQNDNESSSFLETHFPEWRLHH